ncbi:tetratricopeptide repeat protein [Bdellovibrio sp. HCB337]|uniref:tetratricopeptide repeat protein n=1 Tax=Bdellovibrio sp. HCB337 TaxID=3394358 RepID=UPI0039A4F2C3
MKTKLEEAKQLRKNNKPEEAMKILKSLHESHPTDPDVNYQLAWTCDFMGNESAAVPYYEAAIAHGLAEDRQGAFLGLGSTYRCLGEYEKSLKTFDKGIQEFPEDRALKVFRALTLYNLGKFHDSVGELLIHLIDTTSDGNIKQYDKALRFYSDKLDETWK